MGGMHGRDKWEKLELIRSRMVIWMFDLTQENRQSSSFLSISSCIRHFCLNKFKTPR